MTSSALLPCALVDGHFRDPVLEGVRPVRRCYLSDGLVTSMTEACSAKDFLAVTRTGRYLSSDLCWCFRLWVSGLGRKPALYAGTGVFAAFAASFAFVFLSGS